jgi:PKD repeat protein
VAAFSAPPACLGTATSFTNTSSGAATYDWNFGDGSAHSSATNPTHTYATSGTFTVTLIATSSQTCTNSVSHTVTVNSLPVATPSSEVCSTGPGLTLNQIVLHSHPTGGSGTYSSFSWTGPNGYTSTSQDATVTETATSGVTGTYTVTVTDSNGCTSAPASVRVGLCAAP